MKIKEMLKSKRFIATGVVTSALALAPSAFAAETSGVDYSGLNTSMTTSFKTVTDQMMETIGDVLPYALGVIGAVLVINLGISLFKKFTNKA